MSSEDDSKKPGEDDAQATPAWHRARAKQLRKDGYPKMADQHEEVARMIERQRRQQEKAK